VSGPIRPGIRAATGDASRTPRTPGRRADGFAFSSWQNKTSWSRTKNLPLATTAAGDPAAVKLPGVKMTLSPTTGGDSR
jgi:hypothetical protein